MFSWSNFLLNFIFRWFYVTNKFFFWFQFFFFTVWCIKIFSFDFVFFYYLVQQTIFSGEMCFYIFCKITENCSLPFLCERDFGKSTESTSAWQCKLNRKKMLTWNNEKSLISSWFHVKNEFFYCFKFYLFIFLNVVSCSKPFSMVKYVLRSPVRWQKIVLSYFWHWFLENLHKIQFSS